MGPIHFLVTQPLVSSGTGGRRLRFRNQSEIARVCAIRESTVQQTNSALGKNRSEPPNKRRNVLGFLRGQGAVVFCATANEMVRQKRRRAGSLQFSAIGTAETTAARNIVRRGTPRGRRAVFVRKPLVASEDSLVAQPT